MPYCIASFAVLIGCVSVMLTVGTSILLAVNLRERLPDCASEGFGNELHRVNRWASLSVGVSVNSRLRDARLLGQRGDADSLHPGDVEKMPQLLSHQPHRRTGLRPSCQAHVQGEERDARSECCCHFPMTDSCILSALQAAQARALKGALQSAPFLAYRASISPPS